MLRVHENGPGEVPTAVDDRPLAPALDASDYGTDRAQINEDCGRGSLVRSHLERSILALSYARFHKGQEMTFATGYIKFIVATCGAS